MYLIMGDSTRRGEQLNWHSCRLSGPMHHRIICVLVLLIGCFTYIASGQQEPIPRRPLGYVYNSGSPTAPVVLVIYIDLLCPDSRDAFPTVLAVADYFGEKNLRLEFIPFPLSFHRNAYLAAKGIHVVTWYTRSNMNATYEWVKDIFAAQERFSEAATYDMTETDIVSLFAKVGQRFKIPVTTFIQRMNNLQTDMDTRVEWKYTCSRGVAGTPYFTLNDVFVAAAGTWSVGDWINAINPLFK